jgi:hypothetical protein
MTLDTLYPSLKNNFKIKQIINDYTFYFLMCIRIENWNKIKEPYSLAQQQFFGNIEHSPMEAHL